MTMQPAQRAMRTRVAIIGAGPAGMFLAHILHRAGIACVVVERRDRGYVEGRVRAGVLEPGTVALMHRLDIAERLERDGLVHDGTNLSLDGEMFRIDIAALTGRTVTVYGQQEVMRDLFDAAHILEIQIVWNAGDLALGGLDLDRPQVSWTGGELDCEYVVGCDGFHGVCRSSTPSDGPPFSWTRV